MKFIKVRFVIPGFHTYFGWATIRSSRSEVFLVKVVPKICSKFTGEHPCRIVNLINLINRCSMYKKNNLSLAR